MSAEPKGDGRAHTRRVGRGEVSNDLTSTVGANLRRLRTHRGLSLERLASQSKVSRAMLSQIELAHSTPTINVLWKISSALGIPFSALISSQAQPGVAVVRAEHSKVLTNRRGNFTSRALFPYDAPRRVEFYELTLGARSSEEAEPHPPGTTEYVVVSEGAVEIQSGQESVSLGKGDAIVFQADVPHAYRNAGASDARMYLVMTYAETVG